MPDYLLAELKAAAKRRGRGITDELLARLQHSFIREREQRRDPATRALTFLISQLAESIHMQLPLDWHRNPFMFRAFKLAIAKVLDALEPSGDLQSPYEGLRPADGGALEEGSPLKWFVENYKTPDATAQLVADALLRNLLSGHPWGSPQEWGPKLRGKHPEEPMYEMLLDATESDYYQFLKARHALIPKKKRGY